MKNNKMLLIIIVAVLLIAIGVGVYIFVIAPGDKEPEYVEFFYSPGDAFITNVLDSDKLCKAVITLATSEDKTEELTLKNAVLRAGILKVLRATTAEEYAQSDCLKLMSDRICAQLNADFGYDGTANNGKTLFLKVYFTDFVVQ